MNKRQIKKYEEKVRRGRIKKPSRFPYFVASTCCLKLVARYAVFNKGYILPRWWRSLKEYPFKMNEEGGDTPPCPGCNGPDGYPFLLKNLSEYRDWKNKSMMRLDKDYWKEQEKWFNSDEDEIPHEHEYEILLKKIKTIKCSWCKQLRYPRKFISFPLRLRHKVVKKRACSKCYDSQEFHDRIDKIEEDYRTMTFHERKQQRIQSRER